MTLAPQRQAGAAPQPSTATSERRRRPGAGAYPWAMSGAVAVAVIGAAVSLNGVLRGWAWFLPVLTTILVVSLTMAGLRALRAQPLLVTLGGFVSLLFILIFTFFRRDSIAGLIPSDATMAALGRHLRRASETVLSESSPVAPNAGIVLVTCAALGLVVMVPARSAVVLRTSSCSP